MKEPPEFDAHVWSEREAFGLRPKERAVIGYIIRVLLCGFAFTLGLVVGIVAANFTTL